MQEKPQDGVIAEAVPAVSAATMLLRDILIPLSELTAAPCARRCRAGPRSAHRIAFPDHSARYPLSHRPGQDWPNRSCGPAEGFTFTKEDARRVPKVDTQLQH